MSLLAESQAQLLQTSYLLLLTLAGFCLLLGVLYGVGILGDFVNLVTRLLRWAILWGFHVWERTLWWAAWPLYLLLGIAVLLAGNFFSNEDLHFVTLPFGAALLTMGVVTCLTFMYLSNERYQVSRGYKVFHDPQKGQELADDLLQYGDRVGFVTLVVSILFVITGFAQFNHAIYETFGADWYEVKEKDSDIVYLDFVTFAIIHLINIVDFLDVINANFLHDLSYLKARSFPIRMLVMAYKTFFSFVLLQQLFIALRQSRMIAETMKDFWSPHHPIHQRAIASLKQSGPDAIPALLGSLGRAEGLSKELQAEILEVLVEIGPSGVPNLLRFLNDEHGPTRALAIAGLGRFRPESGIKRLKKLVDDPNEVVRLQVAEALGELGHALREREEHPQPQSHPSRWRTLWPWKKEVHPVEQCIELLQKALKDPSLPVRVAAVRGLGAIGPKARNTEMDILELARGDAPELRRRVVETLGEIGAVSPTSTEVLRNALGSEDRGLQMAAIEAALHLKGAAAPLTHDLIPFVTVADDEVRELAVQAIAQIGQLDSEASQALLKGLQSSDNLIRARVVEAFGAIGSNCDASVQALAQAMRDENGRVRGKAIEAVGRLGQQAAPAAVPTLRQALQDKDSWVRALAAEALGEMGDAAETALPELLEALRQTGNTMVRCKAAESLSKLKREEARPDLERATQDPETDLRVAALRALGKFSVITHASRQAIIIAISDTSMEVQLAALEAIYPFAKEWPDLEEQLFRWIEENDDTLAARAVDIAGQRPPTERLLNALRDRYSRHTNEDLDLAMATALGKFGHAARPLGDILVYLAQTGEQKVREAALKGLAMVLPPDAGKAFVNALSDPAETIRKLGSAGLMQVDSISEEWIPIIIETLRDSADQIRANTASILSRRPEIPSEAVPLLIECVESNDEGLRLNTALALRKVDTAEARVAMSRLLEDSTQRIRLLAAGSLLKEEDYQPIVRSILFESLNHENQRLRSIALQLIEDSGENAGGVIDLVQERREKETEPALLAQIDTILSRPEQWLSPPEERDLTVEETVPVPSEEAPVETDAKV